MSHLQTVGARLRQLGRCAFVGVLVGTLAAQAVAEGATKSVQAPTKPETASVPSATETQQLNPATTANLPLTAQNNGNDEPAALPDAPTAPVATNESSSLTMPSDLKAMMQDASQTAPPPAKTQRSHPVHPGWLLLSAAGVLIASVGAIGLGGTKNKGLAVGCLVTGVAMVGGGVYLTFH